MEIPFWLWPDRYHRPAPTTAFDLDENLTLVNLALKDTIY